MRPHAEKLIYSAFFLSGFAGLGYQVVWTRVFALGLGHEIPALLAVIGAFFAGLALGAWVWDRPVSISKNPGYWYSCFVVAAGIWSLVTIPLIPIAIDFINSILGPTPSPFLLWVMAFLVPMFLLLPATSSMGATLPAIERLMAQRRQHHQKALPGLYAVNTLGAALGIMISIHLMLPRLGFQNSIYLMAVADVVSGLIVFLTMARGLPVPDTEEKTATKLLVANNDKAASKKRKQPSPFITPPSGFAKSRIYATLFCTGVLGIAYEVIVIRALVQVLENTIYTFASALFIYLLGTSIGAGLYHKFLNQHKDSQALLTNLLLALSGFCLLGIIGLSQAHSIYGMGTAVWGRSFSGALFSEIFLAGIVFILPTLVMGMIFSLLAQAARHEKGGIGEAFSVNTLGGFVASPLFGIILIPFVGLKVSVLIVSIGYLLLIPKLKSIRIGYAVGLVPLFLVTAPLNLKLVTALPGGRIVDYQEGILASVAVVSDSENHLYLKVNNQFIMGGTDGAVSSRNMAALPILMHPKPEKVLFLGLGPGVTMGAASVFPHLEADGVELVPEAIKFLPYFDEVNYQLSQQPKLNVIQGDARRFVKTSLPVYDVIIADIYHPSRDGAASLYTSEHFQAIKNLLQSRSTLTGEASGLFCQWLPLYQLDLKTLKIITRTFLQVFPNTTLTLANYNVITPIIGLIGSLQPLTLDHERLASRLKEEHLREMLEPASLFGKETVFLAHFLAGPKTLEKWAGEGPLNTDNLPVVTWEAPKANYEKIDRWGVRNLDELMKDFAAYGKQMYPEVKMDPEKKEAYLTRTRRMNQARDLFLKASIKAELEEDLNSSIVMLLQSTALASEFDYPYDILIKLGIAFMAAEKPEGPILLRALLEANPNRGEAARILQMHAPAAP